MTTFDIATGTVTILNERIALVRARAGIEVNRENALPANQRIAAEMPGDYGLIFDRVADYSIAPVEVFQVLNSLPRLKAIAIIVYRESSSQTTIIDKRLSQRPLEIFSSVDDAKDWLESILNPTQGG